MGPPWHKLPFTPFHQSLASPANVNTAKCTRCKSSQSIASSNFSISLIQNSAIVGFVEPLKIRGLKFWNCRRSGNLSLLSYGPSTPCPSVDVASLWDCCSIKFLTVLPNSAIESLNVFLIPVMVSSIRSNLSFSPSLAWAGESWVGDFFRNTHHFLYSQQKRLCQRT